MADKPKAKLDVREPFNNPKPIEMSEAERARRLEEFKRRREEEDRIIEEKRALFMKENRLNEKLDSLRKISNLCEKIQKEVTSYEIVLDDLISILSNEDSEMEITSLYEVRKKKDCSLADLVSDLYIVFSKEYYPIDFAPGLPIMREGDMYFPELPSELNIIDGVFYDDWFIIKTPRLHSRNNLGKINSARYFRNETSYFLYENKEKIPPMERKNITVLSIYNKRTTLLPDNDNIESKGIIDGIAAYTGGDHYDACSMFYLATLEKNVEAGTYFIVTQDYESPLPLQQILEKIRVEFPKKC